jgi:hypothetical protein
MTTERLLTEPIGLPTSEQLARHKKSCDFSQLGKVRTVWLAVDSHGMGGAAMVPFGDVGAVVPGIFAKLTCATTPCGRLDEAISPQPPRVAGGAT